MGKGTEFVNGSVVMALLEWLVLADGLGIDERVEEDKAGSKESIQKKFDFVGIRKWLLVGCCNKVGDEMVAEDKVDVLGWIERVPEGLRWMRGLQERMYPLLLPNFSK